MSLQKRARKGPFQPHLTDEDAETLRGELSGSEALGPSALGQEFKDLLWFAGKLLSRLTECRKTWNFVAWDEGGREPPASEGRLGRPHPAGR